MPISSNCSVMWRGTCHSVPADDVRALVRAGMVRRAPGRGELYEAIPGQVADHPSPADAIRWVRLRSGGTGALAGAENPTGFWVPQGIAKPRTRRSRAQRRRRSFAG